MFLAQLHLPAQGARPIEYIVARSHVDMSRISPVTGIELVLKGTGQANTPMPSFTEPGCLVRTDELGALPKDRQRYRDQSCEAGPLRVDEHSFLTSSSTACRWTTERERAGYLT